MQSVLAGGRTRRFSRGLVLALLCGSTAPVHAQSAASSTASFIFDLRSGETLFTEQPEVAARTILPGSVAKIVAVAAALEAGVIKPTTRIVCTGRVVVDGHQLTCTHPDLHRGLSPAEALGHSCNVFVATVTSRLPRAALDRTFHDLGLPSSAATASVTAASLGLEGTRTTMREWIAAVAKVMGEAPPAWKTETIDVVRAGLRSAVRQGTASAIGAASIDAAAKTGTVDAGGISQGLVVGVMPSSAPAVGFGLLVSGAAGHDAAALAVSRLKQVQSRMSGPAPPGRSSDASASGSSQASPAADPNGRTIRIGILRSGGRHDIRETSLDDYVAQVLAGEAEAGSAPHALDALAITARTYALANLGRHASEGFDLCDLTHCQVVRRATPESDASARRTSGRYLADKGKPAQVYYTASCGGFAERPSAVWKGAQDVPHLSAHLDTACEGNPQWQSELSPADLLRALRVGGFRGDLIRGMSVTARTESGRVAWVRIDGVTPPEVSGENLRTLIGRTLGWQHLKSTLFDVSRTGRGFLFAGRGAGHGVGLCVVGSAARARSGATVDDILRAYFPGLTFATLAASARGPRIILPASEEGSRDSVLSLVASLTLEVESALGTRLPSPPTLTFHPTVESYERSTGQRWFTAASVQTSAVHLLPVTVLRSRGILESTIRHELVHVATADALAGSPRWLAEGVAEWVERQRAPSRMAATGARGGPVGSVPATSAANLNCPADEAFKKASSAVQLRQIYQRAGDCYEQELRAGRSWRSPRIAR